MRKAFVGVMILAAVLSPHANSEAGVFYLNGEPITQPQTPATGGDSPASPAAPLATMITFDEFDAPCGFIEIARLDEEYAHLGVHFAGPALKDGGGVLDQCGNFGVDAYSGAQFLAFNRNADFSDGGTPRDPQTITFDTPMAAVSIYAASGFEDSGEDFILAAYAADKTLLVADGVSTPAGQWGMLSVTSTTGIDYIMLEAPDNEIFFVFDDLSFTPVPEPATMSLLLIGAATVLRRKRARR
jgi:hypothetical protein